MSHCKKCGCNAKQSARMQTNQQNMGSQAAVARYDDYPNVSQEAPRSKSSPRLQPRSDSQPAFISKVDYPVTEADLAIASLIRRQTDKIDVLQHHVDALLRCLLGVSGVWYNGVMTNAALGPDAVGRTLLSYLQSCRSISPDVEEAVRAIYYTAGKDSFVGNSIGPLSVPPPSEMAPSSPSQFSTFKYSVLNASAGGAVSVDNDDVDDHRVVGKSGNWWHATVNVKFGYSDREKCAAVRFFLSEILSISIRRIDVYPKFGENGNQIVVCVYDSDDPSAKSACDTLKDLVGILEKNFEDLGITRLKDLASLVDLQSWRFCGLANELAKFHKSKNEISATPAVISSPSTTTTAAAASVPTGGRTRFFNLSPSYHNRYLQSALHL